MPEAVPSRSAHGPKVRYSRRAESGPLVQEVRAPERPGRRLRFAWPLPAAAVNSLFGRRQDPLHRRLEQFHYGVDLAAHYGAVIRAAAAGRVRVAGWHRGHGREVCLEHIGGFATCYAHLSQIIAQEGAFLRQGSPVGLVGNSGRSTGPHLHFEVLRHGTFLDPLSYLGETVASEELDAD